VEDSILHPVERSSTQTLKFMFEINFNRTQTSQLLFASKSKDIARAAKKDIQAIFLLRWRQDFDKQTLIRLYGPTFRQLMQLSSSRLKKTF